MLQEYLCVCMLHVSLCNSESKHKCACVCEYMCVCALSIGLYCTCLCRHRCKVSVLYVSMTVRTALGSGSDTALVFSIGSGFQGSLKSGTKETGWLPWQLLEKKHHWQPQIVKGSTTHERCLSRDIKRHSGKFNYQLPDTCDHHKRMYLYIHMHHFHRYSITAIYCILT